MKPNKKAVVITALLLFTMACLCTNTTAIPTVPPLPAVTFIPPTQYQPATSGIISDVILATDTEGDLMNPVGPTTVFTPSSVIHAVVQIKDAPVGTQFTAEFYVVDVGSASAPNSLIITTDVTADGTRNIDFTMTPTADWPAGSYRVDILVNGQLEQSETYTVQ